MEVASPAFKMEKKKILPLLLFFLALPLISAVTLENGTYIQTSGTGYNLTVTVNSTLNTLTVTSNDIIMTDPTFISLLNVDASAGIVNLTELDSATIIYDNGTRLTATGDISLSVSSSGRIYIINTQDIILSNGLTVYLTFSENEGTTAYDISGNANNGAIDGAAWENDNVLISLIENIDYTVDLLTSTFTLINPNYDRSYITFNFLSYTSGAGSVIDSITYITGNTSSGLALFFGYVPTWMILLAVVVLIAIIAVVIIVVTKFEDGNKSSL